MSGSEWDITGIIPKANPYVDNPVGTERISPQGPFSQFIDYGSGQMTPQGQQAINTIAPLALGMDATIKAYHGSPYNFNQFDTSKIGTGEGAQAYGHGLYFAENPSVAEGYKKKLAPGGQDQVVPDAQAQADYKDTWNNLVQQLRAARLPDGRPTPASMEIQNKLDAIHANMIDATIARDPNVLSPGKLYQVNLNVEPDQLLDWDKPLSEQSPAVQSAMQKAWNVGGYSAKTGSGNVSQDALMNTPGGTLVRMMGESDPQNATAHLQDAGIPGIRYLDQGSRGAGEGTHNIVMFNPKQIDITHVNGQPLPDKAMKALKESQVTTFGNGQKWALYNGQPVRIA